MPYIKTGLDGLGLDPLTTTLVGKGAATAIPIVKRMMGSFQFPEIRALIAKAAQQAEPGFAEEIYEQVPFLKLSHPDVTPSQAVTPPYRIPQAVAVPSGPTPVVAAGLFPDIGGSMVPLLIAAGLALMFVVRK